MEQKFLELIGMAASVGSESRDCLEWHMNAACEAGATEQELVETVKMAQRVRMVTFGDHEKFTSRVFGILKELVKEQNMERGTGLL
jgi:AhpD family alkylhydroperoxidase